MTNNEIWESLSSVALLGAVHLHGQWRMYAGTLGEWTLDYPAYDPSWKPSEEERMQFRNGLLRVDNDNAAEFCEALQEYEVKPEVLQNWMVNEDGGVPLFIVVDFDKRLFVYGYTEPIEPKSDYVPAGWTGIEDDPLNYVPLEISRLWAKSGSEYGGFKSL
jgi:hypothetical protein